MSTTDTTGRDSAGRFTPGSSVGISTRFQPGNEAAHVHGLRSSRTLSDPAVVEALAAARAELVDHLGGAPSVVQLDIVDDYVVLGVLIDTMTANVRQHGALSARGRTRAATNLLLQLLDRRLRYAEKLGLRPSERPVDPVTAVLQAVEEANRR